MDSIDTGTECINYIKHNNIGRGNFYALEKAERYARDIQREFRAPENAPRMVDLIKLAPESEKFRLAFYHYLRYVRQQLVSYWNYTQKFLSEYQHVYELIFLIKYILQNFRDTLVATDLDQANRIAYGKTRYRVITLNGELIETSGAMSGGGNQKQQGKMGTQVTKYNFSNNDLVWLLIRHSNYFNIYYLFYVY